MESAAKSNGNIASLVKYQPLFSKSDELFDGSKLTVQKVLAKWYSIVNSGESIPLGGGTIFHNDFGEGLSNSIKTDIELIPTLLLEEFISCNIVFDKEQYIKLIQALLTNISDELYIKIRDEKAACASIENTLNFMQNFFYQYFDTDYRLTKFRFQQFTECIKLKLNYIQVKLNNSQLIQVFQKTISEQSITQEIPINCYQVIYLQSIIKEIERGLVCFRENTVRELAYYYNFNSPCFIDYELETIKTELQNTHTNVDRISILQHKLDFISQLKLKSGTSFDNKQPSAKKQIIDWLYAEIKRIELKEKNANGSDLQITPENKIQTTLSVAKLAVLIRLLVVDKIIINPTIAPMLKTVSKLFTTLQKDEISFGSLETKYHAPDKATLNMMKDIMQKWIGILGKL